MALAEGSKAPDFTVNDQNGKRISLHDFKGKKVALYFYPKDDTPGCTEQACNLRDNYTALQQKAIVVLGVSIDTVKSHRKFEQKFTLPFPLLADEDHKMVNDYEVWGEKKMFGKTYMGTNRVTFLINEKGIIDHVISKVVTKDHSRQILDLWNL